jgi:DNA-binding transcriptional MocR family regulator
MALIHSGGENTIRLNFSHSSAQQISDGVARLAQVLKGMRGYYSQKIHRYSIIP